MIIRTPAKVNLTLELRGRRPDGFHEIATWMVPVGLYDRLEIGFAETADSFLETPDLHWNEGNLIYRAAALFRAETGARAFYRIRLDKQIPIGAGLAGGSSNAAATLRLLNLMHGSPFSDDALRELAARLGSDTAFFVRCDPAWCTGRGELMAPRPFEGGWWCLLAKPGFGVATAAAYSAYSKLPEAGKRGRSASTPWGELRNDLEPAVFPKYLVLPVLKEWCMQQPETRLSLMSGSGSTVFAVTEGEVLARALQQRFRETFGAKFWTAACPVNPPPSPVSED